MQATAVFIPSLQDLDQLQPGELFDLTWALRNDGDGAWSDVSMVFTDVSVPDEESFPFTNLAEKSQFRLSELGAAHTVPAGGVVYLTLPLRAPESPGIYLTGWQLQTADGTPFGPLCEMRMTVVPSTEKALDAHAYSVVGFKNSVDDYNNMRPNQPFTGTWLLKNTGIDTWTAVFKIIASVGAVAGTPDATFDLMGLPVHSTLADFSNQTTVAPDAEVALTLPFTAPTDPGIYTIHWQLADDAGQPFGGIRWLQIVVTNNDGAAPALPAHTEAGLADANHWRATIWAITSIFESGRPEGRADAYQNQDSGIVSYGKHQATLHSGNLERVLNAYFRRSNSAASQALQHEFSARVQQKDPSLRNDGRFKQLLLEAAQEDAMAAAQDELFANNFYQPVVARAKTLGIKTALGVACLYDTRIQGGMEFVITAVSEKLGVKKVGGDSVDEPTWLRAFLDEREDRLLRLAKRRESENKQLDAQWLRTSTFRAKELRQLLDDGNLALSGEFTVRGQLIRGHQPRRERKETTASKAKPETHAAKPAPNQYHGPQVTFVAGLHGPGDSFTWHDKGFRKMLKKLNMPVKFMSDGDRFKWYKKFHKPELNLVRVFWKPDHNRRKTAQQAWDEDIRDGVMNFYKEGARNFEVHNEPRLGHEGMGHQWHNGAEFGDFLRGLMLIIKKNCPEARLWYPGESPGVPWTTQFGVSHPAYAKVADLCYGICQHAYSGETGNVDTAVSDIVNQVRDFHKAMQVWDKPIIVSESSVNRAATPEFRAKVYTKAAQQLRQIPGVQGIFWYISHWNAPPAEKANAESWYGTDLPDRYMRLNSK